MMLSESAGVIKGEDYLPMPKASATTLRRKKSEPDVESKAAMRSTPESGPLGGWPVLSAAVSMLPDTPLEEGGRVQLINLQAKTGQTGTLVKRTTDGKWKI